ncbi:transposase [Rhizobium sp. BK529]|nr:transposase [Rhizobium sp. BK529]
MLKKPAPEQTALEMVTLDGLVPKDHLLRKVDAVIDFTFIHERVAGLYCADNGRPALDPTLMFKALFIGTPASAPTPTGSPLGQGDL